MKRPTRHVPTTMQRSKKRKERKTSLHTPLVQSHDRRLLDGGGSHKTQLALSSVGRPVPRVAKLLPCPGSTK